jgi:hypothetical protein
MLAVAAAAATFGAVHAKAHKLRSQSRALKARARNVVKRERMMSEEERRLVWHHLW